MLEIYPAAESGHVLVAQAQHSGEPHPARGISLEAPPARPATQS
jgi:hypothetical protein